MATNSFGDPIETPQASAPQVNSFGDPIEPAAGASLGHASYLQELWKQADLPGIVKSLKEHPLDTVASAIGGLFAPLNPNFTQSPQGQAMKENLTRSPESAAAAVTLGGLALAPGLIGKGAGAIPEEVSVAAKGAAAGTIKAIPNALETSAIKYTGVPQLARGAITGGKQALAKFREGQAPPAPRAISPEEYYASQSVPAAEAPPAPQAISPEDYYTNQGVKPAEVPPTNPAPSAPAPAQPASAAAPATPPVATPAPAAPPAAKVQPIRPAPPAEAEDIDFQQRYGEQEQPEVAKFLGHEQPEAPQPKPASGAANAKSARYADAIAAWAKDMGMSPRAIADQWGSTTPEVRGQIILQLKQKGYLGANETIPRTSAQGIVDALKAKAATIKPPKGFSMGEMGTKH